MRGWAGRWNRVVCEVASEARAVSMRGTLAPPSAFAYPRARVHHLRPAARPCYAAKTLSRSVARHRALRRARSGRSLPSSVLSLRTSHHAFERQSNGRPSRPPTARTDGEGARQMRGDAEMRGWRRQSGETRADEDGPEPMCFTCLGHARCAIAASRAPALPSYIPGSQACLSPLPNRDVLRVPLVPRPPQSPALPRQPPR